MEQSQQQQQQSLADISDEVITEPISGLASNSQGSVKAAAQYADLSAKYIDNEVCSIVTRIKYMQDGIKRNAAKAEQLKELIGLFEKYPETLRMLELMRALGL